MESMTTNAPESVTNVCRRGDICETVVAAVAEATGVGPLELEPLYTVVDPDALNRLFAPSSSTRSPFVEIRFSMAGCEVVVHCDGEVVVTPSPTEGPGEATQFAD